MAAYATRRSSGPILQSTFNSDRRCSSHAPPSSSAFASAQPRSVAGTRVSFSLDRSRAGKPAAGQKRTCMCSPTNHPGSFRCSLHKSAGAKIKPQTAPYALSMRRSAVKNSVVRLGAVEGEWIKRALAALIRPSSHQLRRRGEFRPIHSRLSVMSRS